MRILFDQGTPVGIRDSLRAHSVSTAFQLRWSTLSNGELLRAAEEARFDVLLTTDKNLSYQQNIKTRKIGIVVLGQARWSLIKPMLSKIRESIESTGPGTYTFIAIPDAPG
jgi:hypothetical protein